MRPDLDEYEELNADLGEPRSRAMSWIVLGVAVIGFGALAYYAYQSGSQSVADGQMLVVEAEQGAIKETPVEAGGEEFPHKDKTIYEALSPYRTDQKVETLLPPAEEPVIPEPAVNDGKSEVKTTEETTSYVKPETKATDEGDDEDHSTAAPIAKPIEKVEAPKAAEPAPVAKPVEPVKTPEPLKVESVEVKDVTVATKPTPAPVPTPVKPVVKAEPVKAAPAPAASGGNYKIQLGAYGSDAEARQNWSKISAKNSDVVKGSPIIVKADVNGKTYYRLRASGFASAAAAKSACATLSSRGQGCFPAGQ